ncbi:three-Cys-motif partner protein TcmP (plasmid) [Actinacidiphila glaucinigra]|uniref:three-Cys-motif partner protein TcmP n=1 Tax=Actinacidiphila glaucinigra TaxID=235986 RepID=UPI002DDA3A8A|nr:three-Cys-motif partner protein TcmP [Actinacidiphila glaucinigra]WSD65800.1 three-Cys-motif partner protein TcmP [Actinacidiphila glaucinigra]
MPSIAGSFSISVGELLIDRIGGIVSTGTSGSYWQGKALPSVFKHELLRRYIPPFGGMTGTQSHDRRVVYLDGYAGEGRYENGEPASAEIALQVAEHHRAMGLNLSCFFVEQQPKSFQRLQEVVNGYRARGVNAQAHRGEVDGVLDDVVRQARGVPLFLFLDPCGLCLPMERLVDVLARRRPERRPATELLMNFSMMAVWRLGGHVRSPKGNEKSLERFDAVCGGDWWREYFVDSTASEHNATEAVAAEYARRLKERTGMSVQSVPVAKAPHLKPVYHLVFATRSPYGLWVFGDALARARDEWWKTLELRDGEQNPDTLFSTVEVWRPDPGELEAAAVPAMAANLERVLQHARRPVKLVDHTLELFGTYYGQVTDPVVRRAVKYLHRQGKTPTTGVGERRIRELIVHPETRS